MSIEQESIISIAYMLLSETKITYKQISIDTGLKQTWLEGYKIRYKRGQDFHARKVEKLIAYLSKDTQ